MKSCLYTGTLEHRRFTPIRHEFTYWVSYYFLDIDEIPSLFNRPPFMSYNSPGLLSFWRKDYLGNADESLRSAVTRTVKEKTGGTVEGKIYLLTNVSYFGFCFNPVSFYYCYDLNQQLRYVLAEVTNTPWGEKHQYVSKIGSEKEKVVVQFNKGFHVSPFMPLEMNYTWVLNRPDEHLYFLMQNRNNGETRLTFDSTLELQRKELSFGKALRLFMAYPFVTLKTVAAIYYQAAVLHLKKVPFHPHPGKGSNHHR